MKRFIEGENRFQSTLFPESLEDYIAEDNAIRVIDAFVEKLDRMQLGFDRAEPSTTGRPGYQPEAMRQRKRLVEHPYGTIKHWMRSTHFLMKRLPNVQAEMSLHVLAYNLRRAINILGVPKIIEQLQPTRKKPLYTDSRIDLSECHEKLLFSHGLGQKRTWKCALHSVECIVGRHTLPFMLLPAWANSMRTRRLVR